MEIEDRTAPLPRESTGGISGDTLKTDSEVEKREEKNMETRNITTENLSDCTISPPKNSAPCVSSLNDTGGNSNSAASEDTIETVAESLSDLYLEDKTSTKTPSEMMSDVVNGNAFGSTREQQTEASNSDQKTKPLSSVSVNDEASSLTEFSVQNESKLIKCEAVTLNSKELALKQIEPHLNKKDEQANLPVAETPEIKDHVTKCLGKLAVENKTLSIDETSGKRNPVKKLLESVSCASSTSSFSSETSRPSTSTSTGDSDSSFHNFTFQTEKFKFPSTTISEPSFPSTCLFTSRPGTSSDASCSSVSSSMFGMQVPNKDPDQPKLFSKTSCAAHFDNKLILPAASRDSAFCDFKKEIKTTPDKLLKQLIKIGNNSNCITCPPQKCNNFSGTSDKNSSLRLNCLADSDKVDQQPAPDSRGDFNQTAASRVSSFDSQAASSTLKTVASSKERETTVPLYSSSPFGFSFQGKTGLSSSFSNLSRGEFSLSQSYGKLSFQPLTTHSINFPISCSRTEGSSTDCGSDEPPLGVVNSPFSIRNASPSKSSCSFNFSWKDQSEKKVNNYDESFWNSLGCKVAKTDVRRADSGASLFDTSSKSSTKKTKQPFSFSGKDTQTDKNILHRPFSFTSFFPNLGSSSSPESTSSVEQSTASQFQQQTVSTTASQFPPISSENNLLNFRFKPAIPLSCNSESIDPPPQKSTCYVAPSLCQNFASSSCKSSGSQSDSSVPGNGLPIPTSSLLSFVGGNQAFHASPSNSQSHGSPHHTRKSRKANKLSKAPTKLPFKERVTFQFSSTGIAPVPFKNVIGNDVVVTNGSTTTYVIRYQHISCMEEYKSVSPEELRFDYYTKKNAPFSDHFFTFCAGPDSIPQSNPIKLVKNGESQTDEQGKSSSPRVALQEVWRALECPVCLDVVLPPVFQCEQGHHACASCWNKMVSCPLCKRRKSSTRNYMAETLLEQVPLPCRYHIEGCRETVQRANKLTHEQTCMYRMYQCPYHLCNQAFSYQNMCKHFKKVHKSLLHQDGYSLTNEDEFSLNIYKDQLLPSLIHAVLFPRWGLFFIRQSSVRFSTAIFVQVMHAAPDIPELSYHVEVSDHHDCRKQSYKGRVSPLGKLVREIIELEEYLAVTDLLMKSVKKDAPVKISLTVWPRKPSLSLNMFSM